MALDIAALFSNFPDLSDFAALLAASSVAADLANRSSVTVLAVTNAFVGPSGLPHCPSSFSSDDVLRNQILLEYISPDSLTRLPAAGKLVNTLFQATGRAAKGLGYANITRDPSTRAVVVRSAASNATVLANATDLAYNASVFSVDSFLWSCGMDLMASETRPPPGLNITRELINGHAFNVAAAMLTASGVVGEFEADEKGAGITMFVPVDNAFADAVSLQSLPAEKKAVVLKFHVLHSYYPLGSLESIVNPVQPTLATEDTGAGSYTLNISKINGSVAINTGLVQASVTQTVLDQNPVAIFGVSKVLMPVEIFGGPTKTSSSQLAGGGGNNTAAPSPSMSPPEISPWGSVDRPPPRITSPPGFREEIKSEAIIPPLQWSFHLVLALPCCIGLYFLPFSGTYAGS